MNLTGWARTSHIPADVRSAAVVELRNDGISRVDVRSDWSRPLKAVGVEE
jgi:hypothetical protein